jgi:hypothetical protein
MQRLPRLLAIPALALALGPGCAGPPVPAPIQGELVCEDFYMGPTKMEGGLKRPVRLRVLAGKTVQFKAILTGQRAHGDPPRRSFIIDDDAELTVEWSQCPNERAPRPATAATHEAKGRELNKDASAYECGEPVVYKTEKLTTKKGDPKSHVILFAFPPEAECWWGDRTPVQLGRSDPRAAPPVDAGPLLNKVVDGCGPAPGSDVDAGSADGGDCK